jgi:hypothetical protein
MRLRVMMAAAGAAAVLAIGPAMAHADPPWKVGTGKVDITPPVFNATQDLADFPEIDLGSGTVCPRSTFGGARKWRFEEPYRDEDSSGEFNYKPLAPPQTPENQNGVAEQYCDYNHNGRHDAIYVSGQVDSLARVIHDPIDARAVAISDGTKTVDLASVVAQGLHENYIK